MANSHQKGQLIIEALLVILFLVTVFLMIAAHMTTMKNSFERKDLTKETGRGDQKIYRNK